MQFADLVSVVGPERYETACRWAWRTAIESGSGQPEGPDEVEDVPHELSDRLWYEGDFSMNERLALGIRLLHEMPCYANTMYMLHFYNGWTAAQREAFWAAYLAILDGDDDRIAAVIEYSLWVDLCEDRARCRDAWGPVLGAGAATPSRRLDRVLPLTGPVPWQLKAPLLAELTADSARHPAIFRALLAAEFDYFGSNDRNAAHKILTELVLPQTTENVEDLKSRLLERPTQ